MKVEEVVINCIEGLLDYEKKFNEVISEVYEIAKMLKDLIKYENTSNVVTENIKELVNLIIVAEEMNTALVSISRSLVINIINLLNTEQKNKIIKEIKDENIRKYILNILKQ